VRVGVLIVRRRGVDRGGDHVHRCHAELRRSSLDRLAAGLIRPGVEAGVARHAVAPGPGPRRVDPCRHRKWISPKAHVPRIARPARP
jgi:hypothetical protein